MYVVEWHRGKGTNRAGSFHDSFSLEQARVQLNLQRVQNQETSIITKTSSIHSDIVPTSDCSVPTGSCFASVTILVGCFNLKDAVRGEIITAKASPTNKEVLEACHCDPESVHTLAQLSPRPLLLWHQQPNKVRPPPQVTSGPSSSHHNSIGKNKWNHNDETYRELQLSNLKMVSKSAWLIKSGHFWHFRTLQWCHTQNRRSPCGNVLVCPVVSRLCDHLPVCWRRRRNLRTNGLHISTYMAADSTT